MISVIEGGMYVEGGRGDEGSGGKGKGGNEGSGGGGLGGVKKNFYLKNRQKPTATLNYTNNLQYVHVVHPTTSYKYIHIL